jgi:oligoribonuclease NrnB/cAMP/cGMP phosphodiesterase (DHH superfamily)
VLVELDEMVEKLEQEFQSPKKPSITIIADNDLDGVTSAVRLDNTLYSLGLETTIAFRDPIDFNLPLKDLQKNPTSLLILLDIALDSITNLRPAARLVNKVFMIDHHITDPSEIPTKITMYNPASDGSVYVPAVSLVGQIIDRLTKKNTIDEENDHLILLLGLFSDAAISFHRLSGQDYTWYFEPHFKQIFTQAKQRFPQYFEIIDSIKPLQYPHIQRIVKSMDAYGEDLGWDEVSTQLVNKSAEPKGIASLFTKIEERYGPTFDELIHIVGEILSVTSTTPLIQYNNQTDFSNGILSRLLTENSGKPCIVYSKGIEVTVSGRLPRDTSLSLVPLFNEYGGGGHPRATGAKFAPEKLNTFLKEMMKLISG